MLGERMTAHMRRQEHRQRGGATGRWTILPGFLIRSTGFPFEQLDSLSMPESFRYAESYASLCVARDQLRLSFKEQVKANFLVQEQHLSNHSPNERYWYQLNRCLQNSAVCPPVLYDRLVARIPAVATWIAQWNQAVGAIDHAHTAYERKFENEFPLVREHLYANVETTRFQEALLLSNPNMYVDALPSYARHFDLRRRSANVKRVERRLYTYLQRFCTKNDTTSFFGPIDYGWCDDSVSEMTIERLSDNVPSRRLSRMAYWAAQALADLIAHDPAVELHLAPRLLPGCRLLPTGELHITSLNSRVRIGEDRLAALEQIDGQQHLGDIQKALKPAAQQALEDLRERGLVLVRLEIPTATFDPLSWVRDQVLRLPLKCPSRLVWLERLDFYYRAIASFTPASPDQKLIILKEIEQSFSALTGQEARRGAGEHYTDRLLVYDEAQGDVRRCSLGPSWSGGLASRLRSICDLCASYSLLVQEVCHRYGRELFLAMGAGRPQPYLSFIRALNQQVTVEQCLADPEVQEFSARLASLVDKQQRGGLVRLTRSDLQEFLRPVPQGMQISPDLFLSAPALAEIEMGNYQVVVGEVHHGVQIWSHFQVFNERRDELSAALERVLPTDTEPYLVGFVHRRTQGKAFNLELPGFSVEVLGRSIKAPKDVINVADIDVELTSQGLKLRAHGHSLVCHPGDPRSVSNWLFGTPPALMPQLNLGAQTPRIEIDGTIAWRASWVLSNKDLCPLPRQNTPQDLMLYASQLRLQYGLPQRCFARVATERKPFFVDFSNLFSLENLLAISQQHSSVELTELLPETSNWWLRDESGTRSCEWRMTMVYGAANE
jgi:hypothetical protein